MSIDLTTQHKDEDADRLAMIEVYATLVRESFDFQHLMRECEEAANIDLPDGRNLMQTDEAQAALGIVRLPIEEYVQK